MKRFVIVLLAVAVAFQLNAQDLKHYKKIVKELSSAKYQGRGYAKGGANKAGKFLQKEFEKAGTDEVVLQPFTLNINTFPGRMELYVDGKKQIPGVDFTMREYSPGVVGTFPLYYVDTLNYNPEKMFQDLSLPEYKNAFVVCDFWFSYRHRADFARLQKKDGAPNAGLLFEWEEPMKFYKAYGEKVIDKAIIWVPYRFPKDAKTITANIENKFLKDYECFNVIAKVEGVRHDSCYLFTAHYDHLGNLGGKVYYAGANDNASGTAAVVTLAAYYAKNRPEYDMYFIAFSGEDANLRGSEWYAEHPIVPLERIKYLINIDMIGDNNPVQYCEVSDEGMRGYKLFEEINSEKHYAQALNRAQLAGNSDHYPFAKRHVPCIFFMNEEGDAFKYYHTIHDTWKNAVTYGYEPVFKLVTAFIERYSCSQPSCSQPQNCTEVPFTKLNRYFFKNGQTIPDNPKINTAEEFAQLFGMATVMGENGKPEPVDFEKEFVIAVVLPVTDVHTELVPVSLKVADGKLVFKYEERIGDKQTWSMQPLLLIKVSRQYEQPAVELEKAIN